MEPGTWMPQEWGASGNRLLFTVVAEFTNEVPLLASIQRDDFFEGPAGVKKLNVVEAWLAPSGAGSAAIGRRPVQVKPTAGYKILRGAGPSGTDILRFYVELEEELHHHHAAAAAGGAEKEAAAAAEDDDVYTPISMTGTAPETYPAR